jgi:hypothetical protein
MKAKPTPSVKKRTDWEAVERDYRTGKFTLRELEAKHGANNGLISRKAKKDGWTQDLSKAIKAATNARLVEQLVSKEISSGQQKVSTTVLAAAELNKDVILSHRSDITALRNLTMAMATELVQAGSPDLGRIAEILNTEDATADQIDTVRADVAALTKLPTRILAAQRLTQAVTRLQLLERRAFGLDDPEQPPPVDELADISDDELDAKINERLKFAGR